MTIKTRQRPYYSKNKKQYRRQDEKKKEMEDEVEELRPTIWDFKDYMVIKIKYPHKII